MLPFIQGQLDGLCGIYSSINAVRLIKKISHDQATGLFHKLFFEISHRKTYPKIIKNGLSNRDMAYGFKLIQTQYPIKQARPFPKANNITLGSYWDKLEGFLDQASDRAIIVVIEGWNWGHWTVIERATKKTFFLFDSGGLKRISRSCCSTRRRSPTRPLLLVPTMTYFLWGRD